MTVREHKGHLDGLKMCYIGDGNNMANSLIVGGLKTGMQVSVACPEGTDPTAACLTLQIIMRDFRCLQSLWRLQAVPTSSLPTFGRQWGRRVKPKNAKIFGGKYQVNKELLAVANSGCMVQHCLPAHRGEEITADVFESHADEIFDEAENRLHAQKAVMVTLMEK